MISTPGKTMMVIYPTNIEKCVCVCMYDGNSVAIFDR